jgi:hypothetical protein
MGLRELEKLKCPNCKSDQNLILFANFVDKTVSKGLCLKRYIKPSLARKFGKPMSTGCGHWFGIASKKRENNDGQNSRHIHREAA